MNLAVAVTVFPIIFIGELPDKTMFASLVLATRGKPLSVWIGAAAAFLVHVAIAITVGVALIHLVPHRALEAIVAAIFFIAAAMALREGIRARDGEELVTEVSRVPGARTALGAFVVVFLAEWGDLTQVLTADLAAHYRSPFSVGLGSLLALWAVAGIAVTGGSRLSRVGSASTLRFIIAIVLLALAIYGVTLAA